MILYCCCLDVDDDTDSHPSSFRSCFGSFYFVMKFSTRDRNIIAAIDILTFAAANAACLISFHCSASNLMKLADYAMHLIKCECDEISIEDDGVHYCKETPWGIDAGIINYMPPVVGDELPF